MKIAACSDVGLVRSNNEDSYLVDEQNGLFIVADGMGGTSGGEVASALAVSVVSRHLRTLVDTPHSQEDLHAALMETLMKADQRIKERTRRQSELQGMGTTIIVALVQDGVLTIAHVGDSRAYLVRGDAIHQLTEDHTVVAQIVKAGMITNDEARSHKLKHVLSQALGSSPSFAPGLRALDLRKGDSIILCTDGVTDMVDDAALADIIRGCGKDVDMACHSIVELAKKNGGRDNITLIILHQE